jgi:hypothetical protein
MGDYQRYILVKDAYEQAKKLGFKIDWRSEGWTIETKNNIIRGVTAEELHHYLNGVSDGRRGMI